MKFNLKFLSLICLVATSFVLSVSLRDNVKTESQKGEVKKTEIKKTELRKEDNEKVTDNKKAITKKVEAKRQGQDAGESANTNQNNSENTNQNGESANTNQNNSENTNQNGESANTNQSNSENTNQNGESANTNQNNSGNTNQNGESGNSNPVFITPEIKTPTEPISLNGPPNFEDKKIHHYQDAFNPSNIKELTPEYPEYDVLPDVNHFNTGVVKMPKKIDRVEPITQEAARKNYLNEYNGLMTELFKGDKSKLKKIREEKSAYSSNWLRHQLKIARIIELDDIINKKKTEKK